MAGGSIVGIVPERVEPLLRRRIAAVVETVGVERGAEHLDLRLGRGALGRADVLEDVRRHERREDRDHDDHDEDLDQREGRPTAGRTQTGLRAARAK